MSIKFIEKSRKYRFSLLLAQGSTRIPFTAISTAIMLGFVSLLAMVLRIMPVPPAMYSALGPFMLSFQPGNGSLMEGRTVKVHGVFKDIF